MTRALLSLMIAGMTANMSRAQMSAHELTTLAAQLRSSIMLIIVTDESGKQIAAASGFLVSNDGKLITNRHVAEAGPRLSAKAPNGRMHRVTGVLAEDSDQDLVVLQIENCRQPALALGATGSLREGLPVMIIGNPMELESTVQQGRIAGFRRFLDATRWIEIAGDVAGKDKSVQRRIVRGHGLQVCTEIAPGSSGSPVLDATGQVLGVITAIERTERPIALAIPVEVVKSLLARAERAGRPKPLAELSPRRGSDLSIDAEYVAAVRAYSADDFEEAENRAQLVAARYPQSPVAHLLLGQVKLQRRAYAEAADAFQRAIHIKHDFAPAWAGLAVAYTGQNLSDRARDAVREIEKLDPSLARQVSEALPRLGRR